MQTTVPNPQVILGGRRYNIIRQIGSGGFSDVFLVREAGGYDSLRPDGANEYALKRVISCICLRLARPARLQITDGLRLPAHEYLKCFRCLQYVTEQAHSLSVADSWCFTGPGPSSLV